MRATDLLTLTATLSIALLIAGCNWTKKDRFGKDGPDTLLPPDVNLPLNPDEFDYNDPRLAGSIPFDQDPNRTAVPDFQTGLEIVYFAFDSSSLAPGELHKIDKAATYLQNNPSHVMIIEGHCDERGSAEYNLSLGEFRAQAVRSYLASQGIAGTRLQTRSFGYEKPAVTGSGEAVWAQNRRAVFAVYK